MNTLKQELLKRFNCQQSGNCCRCPGFVYASQEELQKMAKEKNLELETFKKHIVRTHQGWPVIASKSHRQTCFLDTQNRCTVYKARPKQCRTYPDWPEIWKDRTSILKEIALCPGLKKAYTTFCTENPNAKL